MIINNHENFKTNIYKLFKSNYSEYRISYKVLSELNTFINLFIITLCKVIKELNNKSSQLTHKSVYNAVNILIPSEISSTILSKYNRISSEEDYKYFQQMFSIASINRLIVHIFNNRKTRHFIIFIIIAVQNILLYIFERSTNYLDSKRLKTISLRNIMVSLSKDVPFMVLSNKINWFWNGAGSVKLSVDIGTVNNQLISKNKFGNIDDIDNIDNIDIINMINDKYIQMMYTKASNKKDILTNEIINKVKIIMYNYTCELIKNAIIYTKHNKRVLINENDVNVAYRIKGLLGFGSKNIPVSKLVSKPYLIPKATFENYARNISSLYDSSIKYNQDSILNIQLLTEDYIIRLLRSASLITKSKYGIELVDLNLVRVVRGTQRNI